MLRHTITQYQKDEEEEEEPPFNKAILQERLDQSQKLPSPWRNPFEKKKPFPRNQKRRPKKNSLGNILAPPTSQERNQKKKKKKQGFACERNKS